jgi:hypothetical protein
VTADVLLDDILERSTRYLVTKVLNMWEFSMGGSHKLIKNHAVKYCTGMQVSFLASTLDGSRWSASRSGHCT